MRQDPPPCIEFGAAGGIAPFGADDALAGDAGVADRLCVGPSPDVSGSSGGSDGGRGGAEAGGGTDAGGGMAGADAGITY